MMGCPPSTVYSILFVLVAAVTLVSATSVVLHQRIEKTGFHRDLITSLEIPYVYLEPGSDCSVLFVEEIPSGAYVDPYQMANLRQFGGPQALFEETIDVEAPEYLSKPHTIYIFCGLSQSDGAFIANVTLPVHLRYHKPSATQAVDAVTFTSPAVAVKCQESDYRGPVASKRRVACDISNSALCDWTDIKYEKSSGLLEVQVPVGQVQHYWLVVVGTVLITVGACFYLIYVVLMKVLRDQKHKTS